MTRFPIKLLAWADFAMAVFFGGLAVHFLVMLLRMRPENLQLSILWVFLAAVVALLEVALGLALLGRQSDNLRQLYWTGVAMTVLLGLIALGGKSNPLLLLAAPPAILVGLSCIVLRQRQRAR